MPFTWSFREIRRLLHQIRRPATLAGEPLADLLCSVYSLEDPVQAVAKLVRDTFKNQGLREQRLFDLIQSCDFDGVPQKNYARDMGLSTRHYFRYRHEAVEAIAAHLNTIAQKETQSDDDLIETLSDCISDVDPERAIRIGRCAAPAIDPLKYFSWEVSASGILPEGAILESDRPLRSLILLANWCISNGRRTSASQLVHFVRASQLGKRDSSASLAFDIAYVEYLDAWFHTDCDRRLERARDLREIVGVEDLQQFTGLIAECESTLRARPEALEEPLAIVRNLLPKHYVRGMAMMLELQAQAGFLSGDLQRADRYANAAIIALEKNVVDSMRLEVLRARIKFAMGIPWQPPPRLLPSEPLSDAAAQIADGITVMVPRSNHDSRVALAFEVVRARLYTDRDQAMAALESLLARANALEYPSVVAQSLALLASWHARNGDTSLSQVCAVQAWQAFLNIRDVLVGHDLFFDLSLVRREFGPIDLDQRFLDALSQHVYSRFPGSIFGLCVREGISLHAFWRRMILDAYTDSIAPPDQQPGAEIVQAIVRLGIPAGPALRNQAASAEEIGYILSVLISPLLRDRFRIRISDALSRLFCRLQLEAADAS